MPRSPHLSITTQGGWLDLMVSDAHEGWQGRFGVSVPLGESGPLNAEHVARLREIADHAERMLKPRQPVVFDWAANQEAAGIVNAAMLEIGKPRQPAVLDWQAGWVGSQPMIDLGEQVLEQAGQAASRT